MAITFTDAQLREMTGQLINSDEIIKGYQNAGRAATDRKNDYLDLDDQEKVYFDNWLNIIEQFHTELKLLNAEQRTTYNGSDVDPSARLSGGNKHFSDWGGYKPKVIPANNGNPVSTYTGNFELDRAIRIIDWVGKIKTGFAGPSVSGTGTGYSSGSFQVTGSVSAVAGQAIVLYKAGAAVYGICTGHTTTENPGPPPTSNTVITLNVLETYGNLTGSFSYTQNHNGFVNTVRLSTNNDGFLEMCKQILMNTSNEYVSVLDQMLVALEENDSKEGLDPSQITAAKTATTTMKEQILSWVNLVDAPTSNQLRFGDANINPYNSLVVDRRDNYIPERVQQIKSSLGEVVQPDTSTVTGNGRYNDLYTSLNIRIHKISGYLRNYYQMDLATVASQEQAGVKIAEATRNKNFAIVKVLVENPVGTKSIKIKDFGGLSVGDSVKVMDNVVTGVLDFTIQELIPPTTVVLSDVVPPKYTLGAQARLVKVL